MAAPAAASKCAVLLLFAQVVQSQNGWGVTYNQTKICASNGSTVEMHCTYEHPDDYTITKTFWCLSDDKDLTKNSEYKHRTQYNCSAKSCTMKIADLRQKDSREYTFRFLTNKPDGKYTGKPGITLSVTALQVEMTKIRGNESYTQAGLKCKSTCSGDVSYVWLKNGEKFAEENPHTARLHPNDSICCALKGQENYCSALVYPPKLPSATVSPPGEIMEGSSVTLICSSDFKPAVIYTWYKEDGQTPRIAKQLDITSIQSSDSGLYYCTAENELGIMTSKHLSIDVKYAPKLPSVSVSPSGEIEEGMSVNLTCSSDANPAANYTWYKENQSLPAGSEGTYHFTPISSEDRGNYSCKSENQYGQISSSPVFINVQYAPKLPSVSVSPSGEIAEGMSVNLTCSSDANPAANYTWYKENQSLPAGSEGTYHFTPISSEDRGNYSCKSENQYGQISSSPVFINVQYAPKLPSVSVSPSTEIVKGTSVSLTCSSDANPAANYTWYKEGEESPKALGQTFSIANFSAEDTGAYQCEVQNSRGSRNSTVHLAIVQLSVNNSEDWKVIVIPVVAVVLVSILIWILTWKMWISRKLPEPTESSGNTDQKQPAEQACSLHYASIQFSKKQADPLYSNISPAQPQRHKEEDENKVQYDTVMFNSASSAPSKRSQEIGEVPSTLYSSINKALQKDANQK